MILTAIFAIALMICISAVLSATETAITAASPGRLYKLKSSGDKRADIALSILKVKEKVISTMLIGNSFLNTLCTTLATGVCIELFEDPHIGTITASMIMAFLIIVFAEVIPKALAVTKAEVLIIWNSYAILFCLRLLSPVHNVLDLFIRSFCFLFNIDLTNKFSGTEEVRGVIEHHHNEGNVYKADRDMLEGILDIRDMHVSEIMVHRSKINGISIDLPTAEIVRTALSSPNTRIPIWKDSADNIVGIMHIKDLLRDLHEHKNDPIKVNIRSLLTPPWFIPENALVIQQLHAFQERNSHLACVVDEYGDLQGIITLEDILEEIVGQIRDEHDKSVESIIKKSDTEFIVEGSTTIRDLNRELNWDLPDEDATTIAGLIMHTLERIPNHGETIRLMNFQCTITKKSRNKINTVKIKVMPVHEHTTDI